MLKPICIRLPNWVGDACMALPALHLLQQAGYPLVLVGRPWAKDLLAGLQAQHFIALQGPWRRDAQNLRAELQGQTPQAGGLRATPAGPAGVCFPDSLSSALVFRWAGVRAVGYRDDGRSLLLSHAVAKPKPRPHVVLSYYHLARMALQHWGHGQAQPEHPPAMLGLPLTSAHQQGALSAIERAGLVAGRFVLLSPTATGLHKGRIKAWGHYAELTQSLQAAGWAVAVCPPPQEVEAARRAAPGATVLSSLPLGAYAALTRLAALVVCNDSGTSHVAAAAGANQLTLFGVTLPERTGPWSPQAVCLGSHQAWPALGQVTEAVLQQLQSAAPAGPLP